MWTHACRPFRMKCDAYPLETEGRFWILHVFIVEGEEEELAVVLTLPERQDMAEFQDGFEAALAGAAPSHRSASGCAECRSRKDWTTAFTEWVRATYLSLPVPPSLVETEDVPEVVRLSLECVYRHSLPSSASSSN